MNTSAEQIDALVKLQSLDLLISRLEKELDEHCFGAIRPTEGSWSWISDM